MKRFSLIILLLFDGVIAGPLLALWVNVFTGSELIEQLKQSGLYNYRGRIFIGLVVINLALLAWRSRQPAEAAPESSDGKTIKYEIKDSTVHISHEAVTANEPKNFVEPPRPADSNTISISRLPNTGKDLFGRRKELRLLDKAWDNPQTNVVIFVAWGGVGKSTLVNKWLARMAADGWRGAERVFAWSFYSQGTSERAASADLFIDAALRWFGDPEPTAGGPWDKGERLAGYVRRQRTLLILDGLEPLQHPPGQQEGRLKDPALATLLEELAAQQPGLCVVTTRESVTDVDEYKDGAVIETDLENLSAAAGAQILRAQGVTGDDAELEAAATELQGHAFSLTLLGSYLQEVLGGDIRRRGEIPDLFADSRQGAHAEKLMRAYELWLGEGVELSVLRLLGLFDRPAGAGAMEALRAAPAIEGLTDALQGVTEIRWQQALGKLRRLRLLAERDGDTLDAHPLVREHFRRQLKQNHAAAWQAANGRLYEHYQQAAPDLPATTDEMAPLYAAVAHGCEAGRHQEAFEEVYLRRMQRGNEAFSAKKLGALGALMAALTGFFADPWRQPVVGLSKDSKGLLLHNVGFCLLRLGRLPEATQPMQTALEAWIALKDWENAANIASNFSQLYLPMGKLAQALNWAQQSVDFADKSGNAAWRIGSRVTRADALHQVNQLKEAETIFRKAEAMLKDMHPEYPLLHSLAGFWYCDLLMGQGQHAEVKERATQTIEIAKRNNWLLDIALDNLSLGRAWLRGTRTAGGDDYTMAVGFLNQAVNGLRQAGDMTMLPLGLLARAELWRVTGEWARAQRDVDEAERIAKRGKMLLHLTDARLEQARLALAQADMARAREFYELARDDVERLGYHRRDAEVAKLARLLGSGE